MTTRILGFICLLSSLVCSPAFSATKKAKNDATEQCDAWNMTEKHTVYGLDLYVDLLGPVTSTFMGDRLDMSAGIDLDLCHTFFPTFEMGYARWDGTKDYGYIVEMEDDYSYKCSGTYYKVGLRLNMLAKHRDRKITPSFFLGAKYCFTPCGFELQGAVIENEAWKTRMRIDAEGRDFVQWAEFCAGIRFGIVKYFTMGIEANLKEFATKRAKTVRLSDGRNFDMHHGYAPGYGDLNGSSWGVKYEVGWFFPMGVKRATTAKDVGKTKEGKKKATANKK